jgi:hypothetical protein
MIDILITVLMVIVSGLVGGVIGARLFIVIDRTLGRH